MNVRGYSSGYVGIHHCDVVAVTEAGCEALTPFHWAMTDVVLQDRG